jgi:B12-binding domain/radical SAM domain protein
VRSPEEFSGEGLYASSFLTPAREETARELLALRGRFGERFTAVAGGPHASAVPADARAMGFDYVAVGEAGPSLARLVRALAAGVPPAPWILEPDPPRPLEGYAPWPRSGELFAHIEITRGCPMACQFCQTPWLFGRAPRHRSIDSLRALFKHAVATGHRFTRFIAPDAFAYGAPHPRRTNLYALEALLSTARESGFREVYLGTFPSEVRPESVSREALALVRRYCDNRVIAVGMQSGSDAVLRRAKRGHTAREGVDAVVRIAEAGLIPRVDFIFGLPGETAQEQAETCAVLENLTDRFGARVHAHLFTPLPGTPLASAAPSPLSGRTRELIERLAGSRRLTGLRAPLAESAAETARRPARPAGP